LLEALHPRRLPGGPVPGRGRAAALPLPPVDVRRARRGAAHLRTGGPVAAPAAPRAQRAGRAHRPRRLFGPGRAGLLGPGPVRRAPATRRAVAWLDQRFGAAGFARTALNKVFPDHWSF